MNSNDFDSTLRIIPWKPAIDMVPHLTIETNMTCNFRCRNCYNYNRNVVKKTDEIKKEIDLGLRFRKADTITLLGGEPTLHPDLPEIIRYIKQKGVVVQMLTNGFRFLSDNEDVLLKQLIENGLDRILLHIDTGQEAYPEPEVSIHRFLQKTNKLRLLTSLSWTVYKGQQGRIPFLIREFSSYPYFDGLLILLEKSMDQAIRGDYDNAGWPKLYDEYISLKQSLNLEPSEYLPSSLEDEKVKWLIYLYYINSVTLKTFYVSPRLTRLYQKLYLKIRNQEPFGVPPMRRYSSLMMILLGIVECMINPARTAAFLQLLKESKRTSSIRYQYMGIQDPPEYNSGKKSVSICYHCPDATIRNGKITPVCMADRINPLPGDEPPAGTPDYLRTTIYEHLQQ